MDFDGFLKNVGGFGKYQKKTFFLIGFVNMLGAITNMDFVLITGIPDHWCKTPGIQDNLTTGQHKELVIPKDKNGHYSKCFMYNVSGWDQYHVNDYGEPGNLSSPLLVNVSTTQQVVACSSWEYDKTVYSRTIVTQWDLVCGQEAFAATATASLAIGKVFGSLAFGQLSDRFGRRLEIIISTALTCIIGVVGAFAPEPISFCVACFFKGFFHIGSYLPAFILVLELVGASSRVTVASVINWYWVLGSIITAGVSWLTKDWFVMETSLHASCFILVILYAWLVPESPRWLLRKGRVEEAKKVMKVIAKGNGMPWDSKYDKIHAGEVQVKAVTWTRLTKSDTMVTITLISCLMWFTVNLMFYGLSYNSSNLVGDVYLNFFVSGIVEFPAYCAQWLFLEKLGRRKAVVGTLCLSAVSLLITLAIPEEYSIATTVLAMIGKFAITSAFGIVFIYTPEMYPTEYRTTGLGFSSMCGRFGGILAPYMAILGNDTFKEMPLVIFGVVAGIAGLSGLFLPETKNVMLPETLQDVQRFQDTMLSCSKRTKMSGLHEKIGETRLGSEQEYKDDGSVEVSGGEQISNVGEKQPLKGGEESEDQPFLHKKVMQQNALSFI